MSKNISALLSINKVELAVHLGWTEQERAEKQIVLLDVELHFIEPPTACHTDDLTDSVCYAKLIESVREKIAKQSFALVEHLARYIHQSIKSLTPISSKLSVRITKFPAIAGLREGITFSYEEN